jgi:hypothetical protein
MCVSTRWTRILLSAIVWGGVWALGAWLFAEYGDRKQISWFTGMPFFVAAASASWATIRGAVVARGHRKVGTLIGTLVGICVALVSLVLCVGIGRQSDGLSALTVPPYQFVWFAGGAIAGVVAGGVTEAAAMVAESFATSADGSGRPH